MNDMASTKHLLDLPQEILNKIWVFWASDLKLRTLLRRFDNPYPMVRERLRRLDCNHPGLLLVSKARTEEVRRALLRNATVVIESSLEMSYLLYHHRDLKDVANIEILVPRRLHSIPYPFLLVDNFFRQSGVRNIHIKLWPQFVWVDHNSWPQTADETRALLRKEWVKELLPRYMCGHLRYPGDAIETAKVRQKFGWLGDILDGMAFASCSSEIRTNVSLSLEFRRDVGDVQSQGVVDPKDLIIKPIYLFVDYSVSTRRARLEIYRNHKSVGRYKVEQTDFNYYTPHWRGGSRLLCDGLLTLDNTYATIEDKMKKELDCDARLRLLQYKCVRAPSDISDQDEHLYFCWHAAMERNPHRVDFINCCDFFLGLSQGRIPLVRLDTKAVAQRFVRAALRCDFRNDQVKTDRFDRHWDEHPYNDNAEPFKDALRLVLHVHDENRQLGHMHFWRIFSLLFKRGLQGYD